MKAVECEAGGALIPERDKPPPAFDNDAPLGKIECQEWLGGLLKHYHRKAA